MKRAKENAEGWFVTPEVRILIPEKTAPGLVRLAHNKPIWTKPPTKTVTQIPGHSLMGNFN
jgi:hypothetical protein